MTLIPAEADLDTALVSAAAIHKKELEAGATEATNIADLIDTHIANLAFPGSSPGKAATERYRSDRARFIVNRIRRTLDSILLGYAIRAGSQARSIAAAWPDIYEYWIDNAKTIESRAPTFGGMSITSGAGLGNPTVRRYTVDSDGELIESIFAETISIEAGAVQPNVNVGEEELILSLPRGIDIFSLDIAGEPNAGPLANLRYRLRNRDNNNVTDASFESPGTAVALGSVSDLGAWEIVSGGANLEVIEGTGATDGYRESTRERRLGNRYSLAAHGDFVIRQRLSSFVENLPYSWGLRWLGEGTITAGSVDLTFAGLPVQSVSAFNSGGVWQQLANPNTSTAWAENFLVGDDPYITIAVSGLTGTSPVIKLDNVWVEPTTQWNGTYFHFAGGPDPVLKGFAASIADSIPTDSVIQKLIFLAYGFGFYLPASTTPTIADP